MTLQDLGTFNHNGVNSQKFKNVTTTQPRDVFKFEITEERSINLLLTDANDTNYTYDNLDLALYRDNGNGTLQQFGFYSDELISTSTNVSYATDEGFADDHINRWSQPGTYFAVVELYGSDSTSPIQYNLHVAASRQPNELTGPPNTLAQERDVGTLNHYYYDDETFSGSVGFQENSGSDGFSDNEVGDTSDLYYFTLPAGRTVDITLSGLTGDADIRLIEDFDNDRILDARPVHEQVDISRNGGMTDDFIPVSDPGKYYLQVYPYHYPWNPSTAPDQIEYDLTFDVH